MSAVRGPHRLILIRSGVYQYADVEIDQPLHLVAANNVGKTTLIAALQFLYVDDSRQMHFSHDWSATKKHYFPRPNSFVLFECMTELGWWVVGARGLGVTQAHDFERFIYQGRFDRDDFFEGRKFRGWEDIRDRLVARRYRTLAAKDLRHALTGSLEDAPLGLVPLRQSSNYKSFRVLFRNLLRLSHLPARELQELLIDIHRHLLDHPRIDLHDSHDQYQRATRKADGLRELKSAERDIRKAIQWRELRDDARGELVFLWEQLRDAHQSESAELRTRLAEVGDELEATGNRLDEAQSALRQKRQERKSVERDFGGTQQSIRDLDASRARFADFSTPDNARQIDTLQRQRDELVGRIHGLSNADPARVARRLGQLRGELDDDRRVLANLKDLVVTRLRSDSGLSDAQLEDIFRILNPALLRLSLAAGQDKGLDAHHPPAAIGRLEKLADRFDDRGYRDDAIRISKTALPDGAELSGEFEPAEIEARIEQNEAELEDLQRVRRDLDRRAELEREQAAKEEALEQLQTARRDWRAWREREEQRPRLEERRQTLSAKRRQIEADVAEMDDRVEELRQRKADLAGQKARYEQRHAHIRQAFGQLSAPAFKTDPKALEATELFDRPLEALFDEYRDLARDERDLSSRVTRLLDDIERATGSRFSGADEDQTVDNLEQALASLEQQEEALDQLWRSLIAGLRRQLKGLLDDLTEIKRQISKLNKTLASRQISNLAKLELVVRPNEVLVGRIEDILAHEEQPLFADARRAEKASRELARLLEDHPKLELEQLFSLQFHIEDATGDIKRFESLDQIESQGTTVTIKVLIHLELLHRMLREDQAHIPFFLDEVSVLDDQNLSAVIDHATAMNFVPVVASPDARDCVDTLYFLRSSGGEVILEPRTSRVRLKRARSAHQEPTEPAQSAHQEALLDD